MSNSQYYANMLRTRRGQAPVETAFDQTMASLNRGIGPAMQAERGRMQRKVLSFDTGLQQQKEGAKKAKQRALATSLDERANRDKSREQP
jgi:hypothetical protein